MDVQNPAGFYFSLSFDGEDAFFQEVSGLTTTEPSEQPLGQSFDHQLPGTDKYSNLILKRGFLTSGGKLLNWIERTMNNGPSKRISTHDITISLLTPENKAVAFWVFKNAYPIKWSVAGFRSERKKELAIEDLEFAYSFFIKPS